MDSQVNVFVCGTPSNKGGFKYRSLNSRTLPGQPAMYLDKFEPSLMNEGNTYLSHDLKIEGQQYVLSVVYRRINPNDQKINRGAFIGVGVLIQGEANLEYVLGYLYMIGVIHGSLAQLQDTNTAFEPGFTLDGYADKQFGLIAPMFNMSDTISAHTYRANRENNQIVVLFNDANTEKEDTETSSLHRKLKIINELEQKLDRVSKQHDHTKSELVELRARFESQRQSHTQTDQLVASRVQSHRQKSIYYVSHSNRGRIRETSWKRVLNESYNAVHRWFSFASILAVALVIGVTLVVILLNTINDSDLIRESDGELSSAPNEGERATNEPPLQEDTITKQRMNLNSKTSD